MADSESARPGSNPGEATCEPVSHTEAIRLDEELVLKTSNAGNGVVGSSPTASAPAFAGLGLRCFVVWTLEVIDALRWRTAFEVECYRK